MTHKTREAIDEQQKQMQSSMTAEELLFELDQIRIKYKGWKFDIEKGSPRIDESIDLINQFKESIENRDRSCMYCEKKIKETEAIILCKECTE